MNHARGWKAVFTRRATWSVWSRLDRILTSDFCPGANRYVYWLKQPVGWFVCAAGMSLLVGLFVGPQGFVLCGALLAVTLLGVVWPWVGVRAVRCSVHFPRRRAREGEVVSVVLRVHNRLPWPVWGVMLEGGFATPGDDEDSPAPAVALARVPGWSVSDFTWEFQPACRGVYPTRRPAVSNGFPFGLWHAHRPVESCDELIVWPQVTSLVGVPSRAGRDVAVAATVTRRAGQEGDFLGVRPWRQGDSLRHVHWSQTARHGEFIVCERQAPARRWVRIRVETDPSVHAGRGPGSSLEWALRVGASLCEAFHAHGTHVELRVGALQWIPAPGALGMQRVLDALARFDPCRGAARSPGDVGEGEAVVCRAAQPNRATASDAASLRLVVTTDRALAGRVGAPAARHVQWIVLRAAGFDAETDEPSPPLPSWCQPASLLDSSAQAARQLRRDWERMSHDE